MDNPNLNGENIPEQAYVDYLSLATITRNGLREPEICCPNCGSWTYTRDLKTNEQTMTTHCSLCEIKDEEENIQTELF